MSAKKRQKTIARATLSRLAFCNSSKLPQYIELDGKRLWWTGIGWVPDGPLQGDEVRVIDGDQ